MPRYSALGALWILTTAMCLLADAAATQRGASGPSSNKTAGSNTKIQKLDLTSGISGPKQGFPLSFVALSESGRGTLQEAGSDGSASDQKVTRQIFPDDESSEVLKGQRRPVSSSESTEERSSRNRVPARPREEFNGFPSGFMDGLKPFSFQSSKSPKDAPTSGFVDFPTGDFSNLASTLGGLRPFPPLDSSSSTTRGSTSPTSGPSESFRSSINPSFQTESGEKFLQRSPQREPTFNEEDFSSADGQDQVVESKGGRERLPETSSNEEKQIQAPPGENSAEFGAFDQTRFSSEAKKFPKRPSNPSADESSEFQSSDPPASNFRDLNQFQISAPQNFVPVAHFHNGPFPFPQQFNSFRPHQEAAHQGPARNFRHVAPPQFFITSGGPFDGTGNGFFENGGSAPDFSRGPTQDFHRPEQQFRFQNQRPSHQGHRSHQRQPHHNFHSDDTTTHHSSASTNILGSGNFGIIRGGIFADDENPPQTFRPQFSGHGGGGGDDFFHGFRDFQPYGGHLNNALSNIQNAGTKTQAVTAEAAAPASGKLQSEATEAKMMATS